MSATMQRGFRRRIDRILQPGARGVVLLYHRIATDTCDPFGLCISPRQFEEHLQVIRKFAAPIKMTDFATALRNRELPERAVAVTFDGGYIDNLECAGPLLDRYDMPALAFAPTGPGGRDHEYWWDELERIFLEPGEIPATLGLELNGRSYRWDFGLDRMFTTEYQQRHRGWSLRDAENPTSRHRALREIYDLLKSLPLSMRMRLMEGLGGWAGIDRRVVRQSRRTLQPEQLKRMVDHGLMEIGAHTVNYAALTVEPAEIRATEVVRSKEMLEEATGRPVGGFAYPFGLYDAEAVEAARRAGYGFACTSAYQETQPRTDLLQIPRIEAPAADGDTLAKILRWHLG